MQSQVNFEELKSLYNSDPKAKALFDHYAKRERGRQDSTTPRMRRILKIQGIEMTTKEMSDFYRNMQVAGVGKCVIGRRGKVSRFLWGFHLKSVAEAAQGKQSTLRAAPRSKVHLPKLTAVRPPAPSTVSPAAPTTVSPPTVASKAQVIPVPSARKIIVRKAGFEIELPLSMSEEDLSEAALFLNKLGAVG